ncbi:hypothetical protein AHMF7605_22590 [Adhaeribacter arboris]|uniref:Terminase small subunit n=1 Tax=Adhaeribacter arboris TaxID=2072846 RepID=A0A2T2YKR0_9BACT|nr:terminase small subunit [Adhaeribacter arboris]PSR56090.1 hypothetical protein AHMF7605_22590 [Adhaeribacter arboris]
MNSDEQELEDELAETPNPDEQSPTKFTVKESRFIEEFCSDFNGSRSAKEAGYSEKNSRRIAYQLLKKPHIKKAIKARLEELSMPAEEATMRMTNIARANLNEYYDIIEVDELTQIEKPLIEIIYELEEEVKFEQEFAERAGFTGKTLTSHQKQQEARKLKILRMQMELERDPLAKRLVSGPPVKKEVAELNLVRLVKAKEKGSIKSVTPTQFGTKVELYAADAALRDIVKIHGLYAPEKVESTNTNRNLNYDVSNLSEKEIQSLYQALKKEYL